MLQQYFRAKEDHPGVLLAMRVGDFYEFYGEDAVSAAAALEITLTGREDGSNGRIAMAGVPYHSVEKYLARLLQKGLKVALCDQVEDPKLAKGLVRRKVTRVLTPGTVLEDSMLASTQNNFLAAICIRDGRAGLATLDPSTGEFLVTELQGESLEERLLQELARVRPAELLLGPKMNSIGDPAKTGLEITVTEGDAPHLDRAHRSLLGQFHVSNLQAFGCEDKPGAIVAAGMILAYAARNGLALHHVDSIATYSVDGFMVLDQATRRSLEITQNLQDGGRRHTLLEVLDLTVTPMGSRLLRRWLEQPLLDCDAILARHEAVERIATQNMNRGDLRECLKRVSDLDRLVSRAATGIAGPRDLAALRDTLQALPILDDPLRKLALGRIEDLRAQIGDHREIAGLLKKALVDDPPHSIREGGIIREDYDLELDKLRSLSRDGKGYIAALEKEERSKTGISQLKVGYNSVFGYYLEVSKTQIDKVPGHYIRKQTTSNAERFITADLKEHESAVLGAESKIAQLEADLFVRLRARVAERSKVLLQTSRALAELDVLGALAEVAVRRRFVKPLIASDDGLAYRSGRHPVVEAFDNGFVPNDLVLSDGGIRQIILTGPNMSGKSTFLRQTALIVLLAQIGSFVPAESCTIGLCDRIFSRIGAKDELAVGQSTFMVEMVESANILNHATRQSLVILDEVGRGTSTYDGLAIAWAMVEHLAGIGAKTMFATHYHQLNSLAEQLPEVANFRVSVEELGEEVVWTHRVLPGGTDRSYGIHVARMAGVPMAVLRRAAEVLQDLEEVHHASAAVRPGSQIVQLTLFEAEDPAVLQELRLLELNELTPMQALQKLDEWKQRFAAVAESAKAETI